MATIERLEASAHTIPTDGPEADGTLSWNTTTAVVVQVFAEGGSGIGWTYAHPCVADLIRRTLASEAVGHDADDVPAAWARMRATVRNLGFPGLCASAIAAVDIALWDLKARRRELPLATLFGRARDGVPLYGSGGFTSYAPERLQRQLADWVASGIPRVKMKVGSAPADDPQRVALAREAIGPGAELFVDANGAFDTARAIAMAAAFAPHGVSWFEEPVSSDDEEGLRLIRRRAPAGMAIAAGEYGYSVFDFNRLLGCVDVLQADATRCGGYTGFLRAAALCEAAATPLSAHTAPAVHLPVCMSLANVVHIEWFHDHVRIEDMLFDGAPSPKHGCLSPDLARPGHGLSLRRDVAARYAA